MGSAAMLANTSKIAGSSRAAARDMASVLANVQDTLIPYEIECEDGLGYQVIHHSSEMPAHDSVTSTGSAAVVAEAAWFLFLQSREIAQRSVLSAKSEEAAEHTEASSDRFC